jgi:hypothetical protein
MVFDSQNGLRAQIVELVLWIFLRHLAKHVIHPHADVLKLSEVSLPFEHIPAAALEERQNWSRFSLE